ncbi:MAG: BrnT family toxin [bacterium]
MNFEWDEDKNQENIRKHGLDFGDAWEIFRFPLLANLDTRTYYGEGLV